MIEKRTAGTDFTEIKNGPAFKSLMALGPHGEDAIGCFVLGENSSTVHPKDPECYTVLKI